MFWYLQYLKDSQQNVGRLAVARGADIPAQRWRYYDFTPAGVGKWATEWFDYPDLAADDQHLYLTTNVFTTTGDNFAGAVTGRVEPVASGASHGRSAFCDLPQRASATHRNTMRPRHREASMKTFILATLLAFTASGNAAYADGPTGHLSALQASSHSGEYATVFGKVVSTKYADRSNGQPTFLNLDRP
jgi:hypothetical protein